MKFCAGVLFCLMLVALGTAVARAQDGYPAPSTPMPTQEAYPVATAVPTATESGTRIPTAVVVSDMSAEEGGQLDGGTVLLLVLLAVTSLVIGFTKR